MNRHLVLVLGTIVLLALTDVVQAQTVHAGDPPSIVAALQSAGYKAELTKDDSGDPLVSSASSGTASSRPRPKTGGAARTEYRVCASSGP